MFVVLFQVLRNIFQLNMYRQRSSSPPVKNNFQRELDQKMRDRRSKGLTSQLSDDELDSDNGEKATCHKFRI